MLEKANEYIRQNYIDEKEKPLFHVTPETGWMNDPNGFSVYQGKVHLFYQFYAVYFPSSSCQISVSSPNLS